MFIESNPTPLPCYSFYLNPFQYSCSICFWSTFSNLYQFIAKTPDPLMDLLTKIVNHQCIAIHFSVGCVIMWFFWCAIWPLHQHLLNAITTSSMGAWAQPCPIWLRDWMHQSWGYSHLDHRDEEVEYWQDDRSLMLVNTARDNLTFYSRLSHSTQRWTSHTWSKGTYLFFSG